MIPDTVQVQVQLVLRLALGLVFLVSALAKLRDPSAFVRGVLESHVIPLTHRMLLAIAAGHATLMATGCFLGLALGEEVVLMLGWATRFFREQGKSIAQ